MDTAITLSTAQYLPGRASPLFVASLILGAYFLLSRKEDDPQHDCAFNALTLAAVALMTENKSARCAALVGGIIQLHGSVGVSVAGFVMQATAIGFAVRESRQSLTNSLKLLPRPYRR